MPKKPKRPRVAAKMQGGEAPSTGADSEIAGPAIVGDLAAAKARTREALTALAAHWRRTAKEKPELSCGAERVAEAIEKVLHQDPDALSQEGHEWSQKAGLSFILPARGAQCEPLRQSVGNDGLVVSKAGGPVVPTHSALLVAPAPPCGFGVFATKPLKDGELLGEYLGVARRYDVWVEEIKSRKVALRGSDEAVPFIVEELYAAWTGGGPQGAGVVVDAFAKGNAMRYINCSCAPNATFTSFGRGSQQHCRLQVVATRDIKAWEQLSVNYGWYFDDATLQDVRAEAVRAYNRDIPDLRTLGSWLGQRLGAAAEAPSEPPEGQHVPAEVTEGRTEVFDVLAAAVDEARGPPELRLEAPNFLMRFVDAEAAAGFLEQKGSSLEAVAGIDEIPEVMWPVYEVVGGDVVGIPCRCGMDPSLNFQGQCAGIIGAFVSD